MHDLEDKELLDRATGGDKQAFTLLAERYRSQIYRVAYRYMRNRDDALDICQEVLITILRKGKQHRKQASMAAWIYTITANTSKNMIRSQSRQRLVYKQDICDIEAVGEAAFPEKGAARRQVSEGLQLCMDKLPDKQRMTVILKIHEGLTLKEIAEIMQCSLGTAKANLFHAIVKLKTCMEEFK